MKFRKGDGEKYKARKLYKGQRVIIESYTAGYDNLTLGVIEDLIEGVCAGIRVSEGSKYYSVDLSYKPRSDNHWYIRTTL